MVFDSIKKRQYINEFEGLHTSEIYDDIDDYSIEIEDIIADTLRNDNLSQEVGDTLET